MPSAGDAEAGPHRHRQAPGSRPGAVSRLGLAGDTICDTANHGGVDQAVYAYAAEDADWWQAELGDELAFAARPRRRSGRT